MCFRVKSAGSYQYLQIVHSVRQGQKVRQQVFGTLGRLDELKASGRLEALIRSGLRHCENFAVIDAHAAGETQAVTALRIGPDLVFGRLWKECGIQEVIQSLLGTRRYDFDVERAVYLPVLHRLFASGSDRAAERWREDYLIAGTEALDLHHLYRAMAFVGQEIEPKGQKTLGTPRCLKDLIEEELFERRRDLFTEVDLVFFDTTSLYFEGRGGESIGKRGHNKDHRPDLKQMIVGMAVDVEGRPICCEMWPSNTADVTTLLPVVTRMRERFRIREITVVADRGMVSQATLDAFENSDPPVRYIVGVQPDKIKELLIQRGVKAIPRKSAEIVLDLDATDYPLHGSQQGAYFQGYYRAYCYLPLYCFCGNIPLLAKLRDCKRDASDGTVEALQKIVPVIRQRFGSKVRIIVRADSGFARDAIMAWCEDNGVFYCLGLARNERLGQRVEADFESLKVQIQEAKVETPCRSFT